ncbi:STAS domain-containing protein [Streptomyces sp. H10-C2]|uniref:STAS domain-containing protein n=1 Tax=unclassified Streptomyces TaxID=2593676 RepID=UPI0024B97846|nr:MULTISPECIES: STAS domain-containing protein [unclassified Streptomyces]MDJ0347131.1 STAS domain-containing protein [Streptomyces sp. PH10-H1]MDJ0375377.1 STAS domain-containing protein [Streptomyces sp. H10-C2]
METRLALTTTTLADEPSALVISLSGELDLDSGPQVERALLQAYRGGTRHVVLDLDALTHLDTGGINVLLRLRADLTDGRRLTLAAAQGPVLRTLELAAATSHLPCAPNVTAALHR